MGKIIINKINIETYDNAKKEFYKNIKLAIQKIGSSNKTKVLHKLAQEELLYIGFGASSLEKDDVTVYGSPFLSGDKLSGLIADIKYCFSVSERGQLSDKINKLHKSTTEINKVKTTITDTSEIQLKHLQEEQNKIVDSIISEIDYFDLIDIYYSVYLKALYIRAEKDKGKNKLFETAHKIFSTMMDKALNKYYKNDNKKLKDISFDYIFASLFTDATKGSIISSLKRMYGETDEDLISFINAKPDNINHFKDAAKVLTQVNLINSTENAFINNIKGIVSDAIIKSIDVNLETFVSILINSKYKSSIFDSRIIDKELQEKIEELLLNYKSKIVLKK